MDSNEAYGLVVELGLGYFYDETDLSNDEILAEILDDIQGTQPSALHFWEDRRDAFRIALPECSDEGIHVLLNSFGHGDLDTEQERRFFERIYEAMAHAIELRNKPAG